MINIFEKEVSIGFKIQDKNKNTLFSREEIKKIIAYFIVIIIIIKISFSFLFLIFNYNKIDRLIWPIAECILFPFLPNLFHIDPIISRILITPIIFLIFNIIKKKLLNRTINLGNLIILATSLIISVNLLNGVIYGLEHPFTYHLSSYTELRNIDNIFKFIKNFEAYQLSGANFQYITHPIGAILFFCFLYKIFYFPHIMSLIIGFMSIGLSGFFIYRVMKRILKNKDLSLNITFLFLVLPAIQIFYLANLYAIVATAFLGVIFYYFHPNRKIRLIGTFIFIIISIALTFMSIFLLIFILLDSLVIRRTKVIFIDFIIIFISLGVVYIFTLLFFDYDYINSFLIASQLENPNGFRLLSNPIDYFFTRIEDILEIIIFFGPFLLILFFRGLKILQEKDYKVHFYHVLSAIFILITFLILGVYKTGETARSANYILIFLLIPIAFYFKKYNYSQEELNHLFNFVFIQTFIMQFIGWYIW